ncbi:endonuclease [Clostridia bacterium]|nr:endonuclease [Clostridia bacterium]
MTTNENIVKALDVLTALLHNESLTHLEIVAKAESVLPLLQIYENNQNYHIILDEVVSQYESNVGVKTFDPDVIVADHGSDVWFTTRRDEISHLYFERYRAYLRHEGFGNDVIDNIKLNCEKILSRCADPIESETVAQSKKRGMVIGDVQAGKTANYLGLINMACDYGYKVIVLLAGLTDSLRKQTQERVDFGFIGAYSSSIGNTVQYIGVGENGHKYHAIPLTNTENDFAIFIKKNLNAVATDFNKPVILVVKKNANILKSVQSWLKPGENHISGNSILIIDDEADNASVNTKKPEYDPSIVNRRIRDIYNNFPIASYIGCTATPFANIFINPYDVSDDDQDLFPADFIVQLNAPSTYFGGDKLFPSDGSIPLAIRKLDTEEVDFIPVKHRKDFQVTSLPESLKEAILSFLINNVIRTIKGNKHKHRSMMINVTALNDPQDNVSRCVKVYLSKLQNIIEQDSYKTESEFIKNDDMKKLHHLYTECDGSGVDFYADVRNDIAWLDIQRGLFDEIKQFETTIINNRYRGEMRFDYSKYAQKGARVIVVGGFVLSRGLTLEGLCVSYYSRNASSYDTLLQMCRWFGYRPQYENICRIYLSQANIDCFSTVMEAIRDLKTQFQEMELQGKAPREYGLMVQQSPDTLETSLLVTARNKMYHTDVVEQVLNYGGIYADTSKLFKDVTRNKANLKRVDDFYAILNAKGCAASWVDKRLMFQQIEKEDIASLLDKITIPVINKKFDCQSLAEYIRESDQFPMWDVAIANGSSERTKAIGTETIAAPSRTFHLGDADENYIRIGGANNRIIDPGIFDSGLHLTPEKRQELLSKKPLVRGEKAKYLTATDLLGLRERPLLVIYYIDLQIEEKAYLAMRETCVAVKDAFGSDLLAGFAVGFPKKESKVLIKYRANKIKLDETIPEDEEFEEYELQDE